jgi:hypothetical protein
VHVILGGIALAFLVGYTVLGDVGVFERLGEGGVERWDRLSGDPLDRDLQCRVGSVATRRPQRGERRVSRAQTAQRGQAGSRDTCRCSATAVERVTGIEPAQSAWKA